MCFISGRHLPNSSAPFGVEGSDKYWSVLGRKGINSPKHPPDPLGYLRELIPTHLMSGKSYYIQTTENDTKKI